MAGKECKPWQREAISYREGGACLGKLLDVGDSSSGRGFFHGFEYFLKAGHGAANIAKALG